MSGFPLALENGEVRVFPVRQFKILSKNQEKVSEFWGQWGKNVWVNTQYILIGKFEDGSFFTCVF